MGFGSGCGRFFESEAPVVGDEAFFEEGGFEFHRPAGIIEERFQRRRNFFELEERRFFAAERSGDESAEFGSDGVLAFQELFEVRRFAVLTSRGAEFLQKFFGCFGADGGDAGAVEEVDGVTGVLFALRARFVGRNECVLFEL